MTVRITLHALEREPGLLTRVNTELSGAPWPPHLPPLERRDRGDTALAAGERSG